MAHRKPHYYITFSLVVTTPLVTSHGVCDGFIMEKKLDSVIKFCDNKEEKKKRFASLLNRPGGKNIACSLRNLNIEEHWHLDTLMMRKLK